MKKSLILVAALSVLGVAGCASTPAGEAEPELVVDGEEWECRRTKEIGRMIGKKECASPETWAKRDAAVKEATDEANALRRERSGAIRNSNAGTN